MTDARLLRHSGAIWRPTVSSALRCVADIYSIFGSEEFDGAGCHLQQVCQSLMTQFPSSRTNELINGLYSALIIPFSLFFPSFLPHPRFLPHTHRPQAGYMTMSFRFADSVIVCRQVSCSRGRIVPGMQARVAFVSSDGLVRVAFQTCALREGQAASSKLVCACSRLSCAVDLETPWHG